MRSSERRHAVGASTLTDEAIRVMVTATWHHRPLPAVSETALALSRRLARSHLVERHLLDTYPERFPPAARGLLDAHERDLWTNLGEAACRLSAAGIQAILIKSGLEGRARAERAAPLAVEYGDFDLVVGAEGWRAARTALNGWGKPERPAVLEPHKLMVRPRRGPGAHLHRDAEWFGVMVTPAASLQARSRPLAGVPGLLLPTPAEALRVWIAHAVFQNLSVDLCELLEIRRLADPATVAAAREVATREGWGRAFGEVLARAFRAMRDLDAGWAPPLPVQLPAVPSLLDGWRHAGRLLGAGLYQAALREFGLRPALVAAKSRRRRP